MTDERATPADSEKLRWGHRKRLEFIEFRLLWEGRVNRADLREAFEISEQQASIDLAQYQKAAQGNLRYDLTAKAYLRADHFHPRFIGDLTDRFLLQLMAIQSGQIPKSETYFGVLPPSRVAALRHQPTSWEIVMQFARAIRQKKLLRVRYASLNPASRPMRNIAPHAFGYGSGRWHVRAWSEERNDFRDFALDRIELAEENGQSPVDEAWDRLWNQTFFLKIVPNPHLDERERLKIAKQYGMTSGRLRCPLPIALCFYLIVDLNLDLAEKVKWGDGSGRTVMPGRIHLKLENWEEYQLARVQAEEEARKLLKKEVLIQPRSGNQPLSGKSD